MKPYQEKLEGGYRLIRIRNLKRAIIIFLFTLTIVGWSYIWFTNGAGLKPYYTPMDAVIPWLLVMFLLGMISAVAFRDLEIRYAKRDSQRFLMTRNSQRRATWTIITSIILIVILALPLTSDFVSAELSKDFVYQVSSGETLQIDEFTNQDSLGLTKVEWFKFSDLTGDLNIRIFKEGRLLDERNVVRNSSWQILGYNEGEHLKNFTASVINYGGFPITFHFITHIRLASTFVVVVPIIFAVFIGLNVVWYVRLTPIRKKYAAASIYSIKYIQEVEAGEQVYARYDVKKRRPFFRAAKNLPPPPDDSTEVPPPPEPVPHLEEIPSSTMPGPAVAQVVSEEPIRKFDLFIQDGSKCFTDGDYEGALKNFDSALSVQPSNITALIAKGSTLQKLGRNEEALVTFEKVIATESKNEKALFEKAALLAELKQWADAIRAFDIYLQVKPADVDALAMKGDCLMSLGKRAEAAFAYETALNLQPESLALEEKLERARLDVAALLSAAMMATASGNYNQALNHYNEILRIEPSNTRALAGKAGVLRRLGRKDEAVASLDSVLEIEPNNPSALLEKTKLLFEGGVIQQAYDTAELLVKASPNDARGWLLRGEILTEREQFKEARDSYAKGQEVEPGNPEIIRKLQQLEDKIAESAQGIITRELVDVKGIGPAKVKALYEAGFKTIEDLRRASIEQLGSVKGISMKLAEDILEHLKNYQDLNKDSAEN